MQLLNQYDLSAIRSCLCYRVLCDVHGGVLYDIRFVESSDRAALAF
jgi:hypothetical protein